MNRKLPPDTFAHYFSLGPGRSYKAVAVHYGVSKQAVTKLAHRENWQSRLEGIERQARHKLDENALESLDGMNQRHLKTLQVIQRKALETLKTMPLASAMEAVRALDMTIGKERLVRGEPTDRAEVNVEDVIRREYDRWLVRDGAAAVERNGGNANGNGNEQ
jgi:hypothetical protein